MFRNDRDVSLRLTRLFELYEQRMYRVAYAILHDEGQAEDAVMVAFEGMLRSGKVPRKLESKAAERLAFATVRNAAIDQYRKNARERNRMQPMPEGECAAVANPADEPGRAALDQAGFDSLIEPLGKPQQDVLRERFANGSSVREAASNLGISESSVRKRQQRAIAQIRNLKGIADERNL